MTAVPIAAVRPRRPARQRALVVGLLLATLWLPGLLPPAVGWVHAGAMASWWQHLAILPGAFLGLLGSGAHYELWAAAATLALVGVLYVAYGELLRARTVLLVPACVFTAGAATAQAFVLAWLLQE